MENEKVIIYVKGGIVQNIVGTPHVEVKIIDYDNNPDVTENDIEYLSPDLTFPLLEIDNYRDNE